MSRVAIIAAALSLLIVVRPAQPSQGPGRILAMLCHHYIATGQVAPDWRRLCGRYGIRLA